MKVGIGSADNYRLETVTGVLEDILESMGYDREDPFGKAGIVRPGDQVFIKPNWVASRWRESCPHKDSLYSVITHPSVIEAVADKVNIALKGQGKIIIADNPSIDADFDELIEFTGIERIKGKYQVPCEIYDLRPLVCDDLRNYGKKDKMVRKTGDPNGSVEVNLGDRSLLYSVDSSLFRGVFNEREETVAAHTGDKQLYTFSKSLFDSDVYISVPKMKTHQKVGVTLNIKGLVGSITQKNQLVHWRVGYPEIGGDEYPDKERYEAFKNAKVTHRGAWPGNDTIWRMVVDLYEALRSRERRYFTVIDGIMAGEGQGPFCPTAKYADTLVASEDLLAADIVTARYMGFAPEKIRYMKYFIDSGKISENEIDVIYNGKEEKGFFQADSRYKDFAVPEIWNEIKWPMEPVHTF